MRTRNDNRPTRARPGTREKRGAQPSVSMAGWGVKTVVGLHSSVTDAKEAGMARQPRTHRWNWLSGAALLAAVALVMTAAPVGACATSSVVPLPGATSAEGIA